MRLWNIIVQAAIHDRPYQSFSYPEAFWYWINDITLNIIIPSGMAIVIFPIQYQIVS